MDGMTMAPIDTDDVPTLREMARTLRDFRDEFRNQMSMMVRKDVHAVEHQGIADKCKILEDRLMKVESGRESDDKTRATTRNQYYLSLFGTALSLVVALVVAAVK